MLLSGELSKIGNVKSSYEEEMTADCPYNGIDEITVNYLLDENCRKVFLIRQSHLINLWTAESGSLLLLWCFPSKIKKENGWASSLSARMESAS
jgi:hypothetical protein